MDENSASNGKTEELESAGFQQPPPRVEMVDMAVKFLVHKDMLDSSLQAKKVFLKKKGLTTEEIDEGILKAELLLHQENVTMQTAQTRRSGVKDWAVILTLFGGAFYGIYHLYKNHILPFLTGEDTKQEEDLLPPEQTPSQAASAKADDQTLSQSIAVIQSIDEKLSDLHKQAEENRKALVELNLPNGAPPLSADLKELKQELLSIKKLLLSKSQFPAVPVQKPIIPSWQLQSPQNSNPSASGEIGPSASGDSAAADSSEANGDFPNADSRIDVPLNPQNSDAALTLNMNQGSKHNENEEVHPKPVETEGVDGASNGEGNMAASNDS